ncbi:MAG: thioredoxin domain-containing protein [Deltaproteobacteria bacterium]|nr:thioredoxin domain-containing protein [Deltaproteobacteria bacterium]
MSDASDAGPPNRTNRLADETSAYLRQHMHNPVDWHPWGPAALERASEEDKPLLVSIGYSACHWCHVMERESFEDAETAELMNQLFINIKVDREERPDVDQIYMDTVVRLTGHGGWPLTVFCTPDGRPFYGGTYFPPEPRQGMPAFRQILASVADAYRNQPEAVRDTTLQILAALRAEPGGGGRAPGLDTVKEAATAILQSADPTFGGFGKGAKFPTSTNLDLLLAAQDALGGAARENALEHVVKTCHEMAHRGLYDHLGGGFHRYCIDGRWDIPHFEKMLYDQGQLLRTYAETWRRTGMSDENLVWPILETAEFLRREMTAEEGGLFGSQDADSEGVEGKFYVWTPAQLAETLGEERADAFASQYGVSDFGNFEDGTTHLADHRRPGRERFAAERAELLAARAKRIAPATDTKRVASWNGYAASGLARAGSLLDDDALIADASRAADFVLDHMRDPEGRLLRVFDSGRGHVLAFLDDVAAMLEACLDLYRAGAGDRYFEAALELARDIATRFFDPQEEDLFLSPVDGERLIHRPRSDHDGATPQASGLATLGLLRTGSLAGDPEFHRIADIVIAGHARVLERAPHAFPTLARAALLAERGVSVAVVVGEADDPATAALALQARRILNPEDGVLVAAPGAVWHAGLDPAWIQGRDALEGRATAYVCRGGSCSLPVHEPEALEPLG